MLTPSFGEAMQYDSYIKLRLFIKSKHPYVPPVIKMLIHTINIKTLQGLWPLIQFSRTYH